MRYELYYYKDGSHHFVDENNDLQELVDKAVSINFSLDAFKKVKKKDLFKWVYIDNAPTEFNVILAHTLGDSKEDWQKKIYECKLSKYCQELGISPDQSTDACIAAKERAKSESERISEKMMSLNLGASL